MVFDHPGSLFPIIVILLILHPLFHCTLQCTESKAGPETMNCKSSVFDWIANEDETGMYPSDYHHIITSHGLTNTSP